MTDAPNDGEEDTQQHELVIIRRRGGGEEEGHHGGVWKIAHADFMTALMAFFLVMWLITATDEKTVSGIANYFNPMRLSDQTTKPKGVFTMEPGGDEERSKKETKKPAKSEEAPTAEQETPAEDSEAELFSEPYDALDKIAAQVGKEAKPEKKTTGPARRGGQAFRDPFNPDFQGRPLPQRKTVAEMPKKEGGGTTVAKSGGATVAKSESDGTDISRSPDAAETPKKHEGSTTDPRNGGGTKIIARPKEPASDANSKNLARQIETLIAQSGFSAVPGVEVRATQEGILISITDQYDFEMFGIASAKPKPELVVLMDKIGELIAKRPERIVVRGHTDGRPFRSKDYDNWRLSTARAQMAHYMLVRSGIPEERIDHIEGHADHDLRIQQDPLAAANRRIEILLEKGKP